MTRRLLLASLAPAFSALTAFAAPPEQGSDVPEPASLFAQTFPEPTGKNGFEEIVRAMDRLKSAKAPYPNPGKYNTLSIKRAYLSDPACRGALSLLRQGLRKPIEIPVSEQTPVSVLMTYPRSLARLLSFRVYVGMADGDNMAVVSDVTAFLRYVETGKTANLVSGMVGGSLERTVCTPLIKLRDAWTMRDCERLLAFAESRANAPDPAIPALVGERKFAQDGWKRMQGSPERWQEYLDELKERDEDDAEKASEYAEAMQSDPDLAANVYREMPDALAAYYDRAAALYANPTRMLALRTPPAETNRFLPTTLYLRGTSVLDAVSAVMPLVQNRVINQLLGVHAAIRAYQWEHDALPKTLSELRLPANLVTDPFTDAPLLYEPEATGNRCKLSSAGALLPGEDGKPDARAPFAFPAERKP